MRFNNSYELAYYFVEKCNDSREWGELRGFADSNSWKYFFWDMQDKYVRGKPILEQFMQPEYLEAKRKVMSNFIDYIDKRLTFPLEYTSKIVYADGCFTEFEVEYETDNQLTFDLTMV